MPPQCGALMGGLTFWRDLGGSRKAILAVWITAWDPSLGSPTVPFSAGAVLAFSAAAFFSMKAIFVTYIAVNSDWLTACPFSGSIGVK